MISVVMPVFNGERFLAHAMDSLLAQTFGDFEVVAVDDGSTDATPAILRAYADKDSRVRVVHGAHAGISAALNSGIEASTHEWIARIDADDVASPNRFARQLAAAEAHPEVVVWGSYAQHVDAAGNVLGISKTGPTSVGEFKRLRAAGEDCYVIHPTSMLRKDVVLKAGGYDSRFNFCEDFELFDRMAEFGAVVALPEPLLQYRIHATSISMQRFTTMRRFSNFVRARAKARLAGRTLSYEQFEQHARRRPTVLRAAKALHTTSGFYYRKAGLAAAEGAKMKAAAFLAASTLMNPAYAIPRVWDQVVSSKVCRLLGRGKADVEDSESEISSEIRDFGTPGGTTLSVLMPAYNAGRYVAEAIESVRAQQTADWQLLVIDDGSTDDTLAVAQAIAAKDSRVRVITQANAGIAHTLNRGMAMLDTAEWVFLMHADDVMMPNRLERQAAFIAANPDLAVASSLVYYVNGEGVTIGRGRSPFTDRKAVEAAVNRAEMIAFNHPACALRRKAVLEVGGYRQAFWPAEDCDLWGRIVERGYRVAVQDEYLLKYRIHGSSASISRARLMQQKTIWLERCIACRRRGEAEPTWEQFQAERRRVPFFTRMNHNRQELGRTFYQAAIHHIATREYARFVPKLLAAAALEPGLVLSRVLPRLLPR